ncbi:translation elongation factor 4 [Carboxydochorda subterranea]|uniref:Elongation factor 4 n=1 Tax=Carboxydichorda subterranea TaxID=3109565 RepID=A0ABZ1C070_9FIRM|nr:translation elongation factor 4 [Limnochorda sp. L945t]WRP18245.1 translation elongation factor 4 [Limnochorda sp. L945t]
MDPSRIRNFCIIAHVDHGKSTLADRLLERTGTLSSREMVDQVLDQMDLERERGITIKLTAVTMEYTPAGEAPYLLNLIDTPGHVDFSYEVSRSLAACEGALLVVDASQGVEAQTMANFLMALEHDLEIIPVINKIDLPNADPDRVAREIQEVLGLEAGQAIRISAKTGLHVDQVLDAIVKRIPAPRGDVDRPLRALIFDSHFDSYRGVVAYVRVMDGSVSVGDRIRLMSTGAEHDVENLFVFRPQLVPVSELAAGQVGALTAGIKNIRDARVGDTITRVDRPATEALPGYRPPLPMVFSGLYPVDSEEFPKLREALEKLQLNDASLQFEPETSAALGPGFRCGFLGLLHMEIVQERLEREFHLNLVTTAPSVAYRVRLRSGEVVTVDNPADMPDPGRIEAIEEPYVRATILTPADYVGPVMDLCRDRRGQFLNLEYPVPSRSVLTYDLPLAEILMDFYDRLKSLTRGYASLDYRYVGHREGDLVKLDILLNGRPVDALSCILHRERAYQRGRQLVEKLRELIPRQLFDVPIQAAIGSRVIARETLRALRKDVLAKCYGGDVTRKRKLLEKQKEGKKRMKQLGMVDVPQEAFMAVLRIE